jgi:WD40 repeat protein
MHRFRILVAIVAFAATMRSLSAQPPEKIQLKAPSPGAIRDISFSKSGKLLASINASNQMVMWCLKDAKVAYRSKSNEEIAGVCFLGDESGLVMAYCDGRLGLLELNSQKVTIIRHEKVNSSLAIAPNGRTVAVAVGTNVEIWDLAKREKMLTFNGHKGPVTALVWGKDSDMLASGSCGGEVITWSCTKRERVKSLEGIPDECNIRNLYITDRSTLIAGCFEDEGLEWDLSSGKHLRRFGKVTGVSRFMSTAFDSKRHRIAYAVDSEIRFAGRQVDKQCWDLNLRIRAIAFS